MFRVVDTHEGDAEVDFRIWGHYGDCYATGPIGIRQCYAPAVGMTRPSDPYWFYSTRLDERTYATVSHADYFDGWGETGGNKIRTGGNSLDANIVFRVIVQDENANDVVIVPGTFTVVYTPFYEQEFGSGWAPGTTCHATVSPPPPSLPPLSPPPSPSPPSPPPAGPPVGPLSCTHVGCYYEGNVVQSLQGFYGESFYPTQNNAGTRGFVVWFRVIDGGAAIAVPFQFRYKIYGAAAYTEWQSVTTAETTYPSFAYRTFVVKADVAPASYFFDFRELDINGQVIATLAQPVSVSASGSDWTGT